MRLINFLAMSSSEKFNLKWDDFKDNTASAFGSLREEKDFADVTQACEDGHQVDAHKVILAASSPLFQNILKRNKHQHPLIYMRGMKLEELVSVVDFLYYGETNVNEENLNNFLAIAEELKLKGLGAGKEMVDLNHSENNSKLKTIKPSKSKSTRPYNVNQEKISLVSENSTFKEEDQSIKTTSVFRELDDQTKSIKGKEEDVSHTMVAVTNQSFSGDLKELDVQIKSMMSVGQTMVKGGKQKNYACTVCGKEGAYSQIKGHIEANHVDGVSIPCNMCEKTFRSRAAHKWHNANKH